MIHTKTIELESNRGRCIHNDLDMLAWAPALCERKESAFLHFGHDGRYPYIEEDSLELISEFDVLRFGQLKEEKSQYYQDFFGDIKKCYRTFNICFYEDFIRKAQKFNKATIAESSAGTLYPHWIWFEMLTSMGFKKMDLSNLYLAIVKMFPKEEKIAPSEINISEVKFVVKDTYI